MNDQKEINIEFTYIPIINKQIDRIAQMVLKKYFALKKYKIRGTKILYTNTENERYKNDLKYALLNALDKYFEICKIGSTRVIYYRQIEGKIRNE